MRPAPSITDRLLIAASIGLGMRVLDIGCGSGEVSRLAARRVGAAGRVVAIDADAGALIAARAATAAESLTNIDYVQGDLSELSLEGPAFDAVIGRRVLMYLPDPKRVLRRLADLLRTGGVLAFQEHDRTMVPGRIGAWPLHDSACRWIWDTVKSEGADPHLGFALPQLLAAAGFKVEHVSAEAVIQGLDPDRSMAGVVRAMLPRIVGRGVASAAEIDIDGLDARLADERRSNASLYIGDFAFSVCARKPTAPVTAPAARESR